MRDEGSKKGLLAGDVGVGAWASGQREDSAAGGGRVEGRVGKAWRGTQICPR